MSESLDTLAAIAEGADFGLVTYLAGIRSVERYLEVRHLSYLMAFQPQVVKGLIAKAQWAEALESENIELRKALAAHGGTGNIRYTFNDDGSYDSEIRK